MLKKPPLNKAHKFNIDTCEHHGCETCIHSSVNTTNPDVSVKCCVCCLRQKRCYYQEQKDYKAIVGAIYEFAYGEDGEEDGE